MTKDRVASVRPAQVHTLLFAKDPPHEIVLDAEVTAHLTQPREASAARSSSRPVHSLRAAPATLRLVDDIFRQRVRDLPPPKYELSLTLPRGVWPAQPETAFRLEQLGAAILLALVCARLQRPTIRNAVVFGEVKAALGTVRIPAEYLPSLRRYQADHPKCRVCGLGPPTSSSADDALPTPDVAPTIRGGPSLSGDRRFPIWQLLRSAMANPPELQTARGFAHESEQPDPDLEPDTHRSPAVGAEDLVGDLLRRLSARELARAFARPVVQAQLGYRFAAVTTESYQAFLATLWPFYARLRQAVSSGSVSAEDPGVQAECLAALEQAYADEGGVAAAWAEARVGIQGGIPCVAGRLAGQVIKNLQIQHVSRLLCEKLSSLSWTDRVAAVRQFIHRLALHIDEDAGLDDPARYLEHIEQIAITYVHSLDDLRTRFLSL